LHHLNLFDRFKNSENKKAKFKINQTAMATKKLIKEPKDTLIKNLEVAIKN
jgi:hypothetical protein